MEWNVKPINGHPNQPYISKETYNYFAALRNATPIDLGGLSDQESEADEVVNIKAVKQNISVSRENTFKQNKNTSRYPPQRFSTLTSEQHKTYLELCSKFKSQNPVNSQEHKEWLLLKELQIKVSKEQEEFMKFLKHMAGLNVDRYCYLPPNADVYLKRYINKLKRRVLRFPKYYVLHDAVSLLPNNLHSIPSITLISILLEMGCVAKTVTLNLNKMRHFLLRDWTRVDRRFPCDDVDEDAHFKEISEDVNIDRLVEEFPVDVATSFPVLECLFDNHAPYFNRPWEIPVKVKKDSKGKTFVTIDDVFVSKNMTTPEKNLLFQELSLKTLILHPKHANVFNLETRRGNTSSLNNSTGSNFLLASGEEEEEDDIEIEKPVPEVESYAEHDLFDDNGLQLDDLEQRVLLDIMPVARSSLSGSDVLSSLKKNDEAAFKFSSDVASESDAEDAFVIDAGHLSPIRSFDGHVDDTADAPCSNKEGCTTSATVSTVSRRKSPRLPYTSTPTKIPPTSSANKTPEMASPKLSISLETSNNEMIEVSDVSMINKEFQQVGNNIVMQIDEPVASSKSRKRTVITEPGSKIRISSVADPNTVSNFTPTSVNSLASTNESHGPMNHVNRPAAAENCPLDVILKEQSKMLNKSVNQSMSSHSIAGDSHATKKIVDDPFYRNSVFLKSPEYYEKPCSGNVSYSLWKIGDTNLLLRDSYHGFVKRKQQPVNLIHLFVKLEYQRKFGFEQTTLSELSRMWLALKMKPGVNSIALNRVDACSSELLRQESVRLENITCSFHKSLQQLEMIFNSCKKLEVGSYLISHTQGNPHFQIKKSTENPRGSYDLHLAYNQPELTLTGADTVERHWLPIDVNIRPSGEMTKIPCTFEPRDTKMGNKKR